MSSQVVDDRVVEMRFDNSQFEANVNKSILTLDKLKKSLNLEGSAKGLEEVGNAAKKCDLSPIGKGIEAVQLKFSAFQVMATTTLATITSAAINAGSQIASAFTFDAAIQGLHEYETQIGGIQTILSNTKSKGTTLDQVNEGLDELNKYADLTKYNFSEMVKNIGTFTAAGVDLEKSITSIKGIANLGAASGSTAFQVESAMYQLSQALAAGRVSLMDWNSVVNAGMGGELFQNALKRTAEHFGTDVDGMIKKYGSFRESLTRGEWLTAEVLTETLTQLSGAYTEADLIAQGYTDQQAKDIVELANTALDAATELKTFSSLMDNIKEVLGSGWAQTWEILIGDYEEATQLFTGLSKVIGGAIEESARARNEMLQQWKDLGGREALLQGLGSVFEYLASVMKPVQEAFKEIFPPMTAEKLLELTEKFRTFASGLKLSSEAAEDIKNVFKGIFTVVRTGIELLGSLISGFFNAASGFSDIGGKLLSAAGDLGSFVSQIGNVASESKIFDTAIQTISSGLRDFISFVSGNASAALEKFTSIFSGIANALGAVASAIGTAVTQFGSNIGNIFTEAGLQGIIDLFNSGLLAVLVVSIQNFFNNLTGAFKGDTFNIFDSFFETVSDFSDNVSDILDEVRGSLEAWQQNLQASALMKLAIAIAILAASLTVLASIDKERLTDALGAISVLFLELIGSMAIFTKMPLSLGQFAGVTSLVAMATALYILSETIEKLARFDLDRQMKSVLGLAGIAAVLTAMAKVLSAGSGMNLKGSFNLILIAAAIKILASVCEDLSKLDYESLGKGLLGVTVLLGALGAYTVIAKFGGNLMSTAVATVVIAAALKILVSVCKDLGEMPTETIVKGILSIVAVLGSLVVISKFAASGGLAQGMVGIVLLTGALYLLLPAIERLSKIPLEGTASAIGAVTGILGALIGSMKLLSVGGGGNILETAATIPAMTSSLLMIADSVEKIANLKIENVATATAAIGIILIALTKMMTSLPDLSGGGLGASVATLAVLTGALTGIAEAINRIGQLNPVNAIASAAALVVVTASVGKALDGVSGKLKESMLMVVIAGNLLLFAAAINLMSSGGIIGVATSLVALAGTFTIIGVATKFLSPMIPRIVALSGSLVTLSVSMSLLGVAMLAVGTGVVAILTGVVTTILLLQGVSLEDIAKGLAAIALAFTSMGVAAKLLRPMIPSIMSLSYSIAALGVSCLAVALSVSLLVGALMVLGSMGEEQAMNVVNAFTTMIIGISNSIPELVDSLTNSFKAILLGLLDVIVECTPQIVDGILKMLMETIRALNEYLPMIVDFIVDFVIKLFDVLTARVPELVDSISNFVGAVFNAIVEKMSGLETSGLLTSAGIIAGIMLLVVGFSQILPLIPTAALGVLGVGAIIAELTLVLAALGALNQIEGLSWFVSEGGNLLQAVGTAIGQFVGGIVGGVAQGATATLPEVANNLTNFMNNLQGFVEGAKSIDQSALTGIGSISSMILSITGAGFLDAITQFITGESSFDKFAEQIVPFGNAIRDFSNIFQGVDVGALSSAAIAGQALAQLAASLPKEGGLAQAIFGETVDMATFGAQLVSFGMSMAMYSASLAGFNAEAVVASASAGQALAQLASSLPKEGGLAQAIFGENVDMATFGAQLVAFGLSMSAYSSAVSGINAEAITASATAGQALSDLANKLPKEGGLAQAIFGENVDMATFGAQLVAFGLSMSAYSTAISGIDTAAITNSAAAGQALSDLASSLNEEGGIVALLFGEKNDIGTFGTQIVAFGNAISEYANSVSGIDFTSCSAAIANANSLVSLIKSMVGLDTSGISAFAQGMKDLGTTSVDSFVSAFRDDGVAKVNEAVTNMANSAVEAFSIGMQGAVPAASSAGATIAQSIADGITAGIGVVTTAAMNTATNVVNAFKDAITNQNGTVNDAATQLAQGAVDSINNKKGDFESAGRDAGSAYESGINSKRSSVMMAASNLVNAAKQSLDGHWATFYDIGSNLAQGFADGITNTSFAARTASRAMAQAAADEAKATLDENSPSKVMYGIGAFAGEGFVNGLYDYASASSKAGKSVAGKSIDAMRNAISNASAIAESEMNLNPVITPVIDSSRIKKDSKLISNLFGGKVSFKTSESASLFARSIGSIQNGSSSDVVNAIDKLRKDIYKMETGNTVYVDGAIVNDDAQMRAVTKDFLVELSRKADL